MRPTWGDKKITPEGRVKQGVREYMRIMGWFIFPIMQGPLSHPGISDYIAIKDGKVLFIECKAPGNNQSAVQKIFQEKTEAHGGIYELVRDFEELRKKGY